MAVDRSEINAATCVEYRRLIGLGYERTEAVQALAIRDRITSDGILKRLRKGGVLSPYRASYSLRGLRRIDTPPVDPSRRVERDPCPRCGIRGDIGCKHGRVSGLTNMVFA